MLTLADRVAGSLLGLALGDALGFVVESAPPEVARAYVREELARRRLARSRAGFPLGQYSDDTQLARALLLSVRDAGSWSGAAFGLRVAELFRAGRPVGAGPGTRTAAARLAGGTRWLEAGTPPPYCGNGGAMRVAPLGVLLADEPDGLVAAAMEQCLVTHKDPRCIGGAVAVAGAASLAARPGPLDAGPLFAELASMVAPTNQIMAGVIRDLDAWLDLEPDDALEALRQAGLDPGERGPWRGISTHVVPSVAWSLYAAFRSPDDYWKAVQTAIEVGGDTDTMAAIAGGIVGGRVGVAGLPTDLLGLLTDQGEWPAAELELLARECAALRSLP